MGTIRKSFPVDYRRQVVKELALSNLSIRDFARKKEIGVSTIARWKSDYSDIFEAAANSQLLNAHLPKPEYPVADHSQSERDQRVVSSVASSNGSNEFDELRKENDRLRKAIDALLGR